MILSPGASVRMRQRTGWYLTLVLWGLSAGLDDVDGEWMAYEMKQDEVALVIATRSDGDGYEALLLCNGCIGWVYQSQVEVV